MRQKIEGLDSDFNKHIPEQKLDELGTIGESLRMREIESSP